MQQAKKVGAVEPIYYSDAQVFEGSNSNIFAVINGKLSTPASNILKGITRGVLLKILKLNIPLEEKDFTLQEFLTATEAFLTGSGKEITPITAIDGKPLGSGEVGPITKEVMRQFREYTSSDLW
jgi:branched-subunit amino acid aminotransferase/4-amino-4-deoxychorismate lyase